MFKALIKFYCLFLVSGTSFSFAGELTLDDLQGKWKLVTIGGQAVVSQSDPDLMPRFSIEDLTINGFDGCNRFWGQLDKPGSIASTRMACPESTLKIPLDMNDVFSHLKMGKMTGKNLILPALGSLSESVFEKE